uniref:Reverse transcriptase domain-containing protein n=1 Tax=Tanacetum cinerariifolium TaxID=118510 RepID=A0A6L2LTB1_TANCI|nr:reverse transcriptase domain-containing protein [Tanacetum cinerariifolium]
MSTRSSTRNLFPPLDNPELTIRRRPRVDPTLLKDFEMATNRNGDDMPSAEGGDLPVPNLRTMEELCQPTLNGRGGPINPIAIQATNFGLKNDMIQQHQSEWVIDDALHLYLFPHSLTHHATAWFDRLPRISITTFKQMAKMFLGKYFPPSMVTKLRNEITNFCQCPDESLFKAWECYKLSIDRCPNHNMLPVTQIDTFYNGLPLRHRDTINAAAGGTFKKRRPKECYDLIKNMTDHQNDWDTSVQRSKSSSSITSSSDSEIAALKAEMVEINKNLMKVLQINQQVKAFTHYCETYGGPHSYNGCPATVGQTQNVYAARAYNQGGNSYQPQGNSNLLRYRSDNYLRPPGFNQNQNQSNQNQNYQNQNMNQGNNHGNVQGNNQGRNQSSQRASHGQNPPPAYQALAYQALVSLPKLSPTCMTLELADRSISRPVRVVEYVFVKVGTFHFPADFVVVEFDADPRVLLILGRSFLKTRCALIDVYEGELTFRVGNKAITFNLDQILRYFTNYDMLVNRIDLSDVACEEYSQKVLGYFVSGNAAPFTKPIVSNSSPTLTHFRDNDFLLKETDAFLAIDDEPISPEINDFYYDSEGDIPLLEEFLNDDPSSPHRPP